MSVHGITIQEQATSFSPPVEGSAALPVFIGTAPIHRVMNATSAPQKPIIAYSYAEAVSELGYSDDWDKWTLCEAMDSQFRQFSVAPAIFINVFDPTNSPALMPATVFPIIGGKAVILDELAIPSTIVVDGADLGTDYTVALSAGGITITPTLTGVLAAATQLEISYSQANPSVITEADIIGGVDASGNRTGIELVDTVFPKTRKVPGLLCAPGWSSVAVTQTLTAKARSINGLFKCMCVADVPDGSIQQYKDLPAWKESKGISSEFTILCWPKVTLGTKIYHLSSQLCGLMGRVDYDHGDVPYHSPSNQALQMDGMLWNGNEVVLDQPQANYLNDNGIVTALNWTGGWRAWGNRTCTYPANTDPKDSWIPVRRMFNWIATSIILTYWRRIDLPIRRVLIDDICTGVNMWLAGLTSAGALLGGRIEFLPGDNPQTAIMDGKIKFRVYICPPTPAQEIEFVLEYDPEYLSVLAA